MQGLNAWIERYFPCPIERGGPLLVIVGVFSTLLYVYTRIAFKDEIGELPQNIMILTFFISAWGQRKNLRSDLIFRLLIVAFLLPWLLFGINALIDYESAVQYRSMNDLLKLFLFLPLAWWMGGSRAGALRMLTIAFLGLLTAVLLDPNLMQSLKLLWSGHRVDFAIHNAQHGALFFGLVTLFGACSLSQRVRNGPAVNRINALLVLVSLVGMTGLIGTQTRAAILGLLACGLIVLVQGIRHGHFFGRNHVSMAKSLPVVALVAVLLAWPAKEILYERLAIEQTAFGALLERDLESVPFTSVGIRIHSWVQALEWIAKRPITGWGLKARSDVIQLGGRFPDDIKNVGFEHLHNGYLEIVLGFGIVGFVFLGMLWIVLLRRIKSAASRDFYTFALYGSVFFLVMNMFESFFIYWSGEFAMSLFMAGGYSQYLARSLGDEPSRSDTPHRDFPHP